MNFTSNQEKLKIMALDALNNYKIIKSVKNNCVLDWDYK